MLRIFFLLFPVLSLSSIPDPPFDDSPSSHNLASASVCEYYNATCFAEAHKKGSQGDIQECYGNETCSRAEVHNCYVVWSKIDSEDGQHRHRSGLSVKMMGCLLKSNDCQKKDVCKETKEEDEDRGNHLFCCCRGDMCNANFSWSPRPKPPPPPSPPITEPPQTPDPSSILYIFLFTIVPILLVVVLLVGWYVYRQRKDAHDLLAATRNVEQGGLNSPPSIKLMEKHIDLLGVMAEGRFGRVSKGKIDNDFVAVKVFPLQEKQSWCAEQEIYKLPRMNHDNILKFIGVDISGEGLSRDYWLVTEFHELGSLCDFLKSNTVSWQDMCRIAHSMACGLSHLHEELPPKGTLDMKLAVAHRDFKSKNVLIKSDLTCCIGDFGLALIFEPGKPIGDTHGQVGTRRYMAPEILEGAITFSRDSFLRIDMYACGLVLWELASRCQMNGLSPKEYKLPFEEEMSQPSLEQMQDLVVNRKVRPAIPETWTNNSCMSELAATIRDCWDQDAEARLSASNVKERIKAMRELHTRLTGGGSQQQQLERQLNMTNSAISAAVQESTTEEHEMMPLIMGSTALGVPDA